MFDEEYARKVVPFLASEYFNDAAENVVMRQIVDFFTKYNKLPNKEVITYQLNQMPNIRENVVSESLEIVEQLSDTKIPSKEWMLEQTEKFCKDKSVYNAIMRSIKIIEGEDKQLSQDAIPKLLQDALSVTFDTAIGHSYTDDVDSRYDFYTRSAYRDWETDRKSTRLNSSHSAKSRMPSSA